MRALPHPTAHIEENGMDTTARGIVTKQLAAVAVAALLAAGGCATQGGGAPVTIGTYGPNVVSSWDEIAVATVRETLELVDVNQVLLVAFDEATHGLYDELLQPGAAS